MAAASTVRVTFALGVVQAIRVGVGVGVGAGVHVGVRLGVGVNVSAGVGVGVGVGVRVGVAVDVGVGLGEVAGCCWQPATEARESETSRNTAHRRSNFFISVPPDWSGFHPGNYGRRRHQLI